MNKKNIGIIVLLLLSIVSFAGCGEKKTTAEDTQKPIPVSVIKAVRTTVESIVTVNGRVEAVKQVNISAKVPGKVEKINFNIGDKVNKGDVLFVLEQKDISLTVSQAEAAYSIAKASYNKATGGGLEQQMVQLKSAYEIAKANYEDAKLNYERTKELYEADGVSKQAFEGAEIKFKLCEEQYISAKANYELTEGKINPENIETAKAQLQQAKAAYDIAKSQLENTEVKAAISGIVASKSVKVGEMTSSTVPGMSIADLSSAVLKVGVTEEVINKIKVGDKVKVNVKVASDNAFDGAISSISPVADSKTQAYPIEILMGNNTGMIKGGMFAEIRIPVDKAFNALAIPLESIIDDSGKKVVYVVDGNKAVKKEITIGYSDGILIQVLQGIKDNESVISEGQSYLQDGSKVMIVK
ncbi:MAG: efflux RND transporter periplasmic adaptor subunit [Ignavibacteriales bacterium]